MKSIITLLSLLAFAGCVIQDGSSPSSTTTNAPAAQNYFFPQTNGFQYTYSEHNNPLSDTSSYQVIVSSQYGSYTKLQKEDPVSGNLSTDVLYFYIAKKDNDGVMQCLLSHDASGSDALVALQGTLEIGSSWYADDAKTVQATVLAHYDVFIMPGHEQTYNDVVAVKYTTKGLPGDTYSVRYFAKDFGLILDRSIVGQASEISNLQLLSRDKLSVNTGDGSDNPNRWYQGNFRFSIMPKLDEDNK
jgi:hypothetical protein